MVASAAVLTSSDPTDMPYELYVARYWRGDAAFRDNIRKSLADLRAGRVTPWREVKKELGIG
jgi:hypothetical protein